MATWIIETVFIAGNDFTSMIKGSLTLLTLKSCHAVNIAEVILALFLAIVCSLRKSGTDLTQFAAFYFKNGTSFVQAILVSVAKVDAIVAKVTSKTSPISKSRTFSSFLIQIFKFIEIISWIRRKINVRILITFKFDWDTIFVKSSIFKLDIVVTVTSIV